jgi:glycosyltransferase involved in cell wall biosynthesis
MGHYIMIELSIITPAWRCAWFLKDYCASIFSQSWFKENEDAYEVLLGIDGCTTTKREAKKLKEQYPKLQIFWFPENHGPYVVRNTLAYQAQGKRLLFFDADDAADPDMVTLGMAHGKPVMRMLQRYSARNNGRPSFGQFFCDREVFIGLGGFFPWRCDADGEFLERTRRVGHPDFTIPDKVLVHRRSHGNQITKVWETSVKGGPLRLAYKKLRKELREQGVIWVEPVVAEFRRVK